MVSSVGSILGLSTVSAEHYCAHVNLTISLVKEHVAIIIMSSTAAVSATAIQVISVQDRECVATRAKT